MPTFVGMTRKVFLGQECTFVGMTFPLPVITGLVPVIQRRQAQEFLVCLRGYRILLCV